MVFTYLKVKFVKLFTSSGLGLVTLVLVLRIWSFKSLLCATLFRCRLLLHILFLLLELGLG